MLDPTEGYRKFDFRTFGNQFFIRKTDSLEINNQIKNGKYLSQVSTLESYYQDFANKFPDIGKQEIIEKGKNKKK